MVANKSFFYVFFLMAVLTIYSQSSLCQTSAPTPSKTGEPSTKTAKKTATLRAQRLVMRYKKCQDAKALFQDEDKLAKLDADGVNEVSAVWQTCANARHNKLYPDDPRVTVVTRLANDPNKKVEVKTVRLHDLSSVRQVCNTAAQTFFIYAEGASSINPIAKGVVTAVDVVTDSGKTDCSSFIHGAEMENPLVIFTPSIIAGSGITMRILSMIGAGDAAQQVQAAVDNLGAQIKDTAAQTVQQVMDHPLVYVTPQIANLGPVPVPAPPPSPLPQQQQKQLEKIAPPPRPCVWVPFKGCVIG
jgi:hypothetical protein